MSERYTLLQGDCITVLSKMADDSVDSIVTDPPYLLGFMGKAWDSSDGIAGKPDVWRECLRVLKPGGHLLAFGGTRTTHRMVCAIEDAGFEIRDRFRFECGPQTKYGALWDSLTDDQRGALLDLLNDQCGLGSELAWEYGSGFPKSMDVSKAIDKAAGAMCEVVGPGRRHGGGSDIKGGSFHTHAMTGQDIYGAGVITAPETDAAREWSGWGTALKPAHEPICVARKPFKGTVAANVLEHGTGALNIDTCRVPTGDKLGGGGESAESTGKFTNEGWQRPWMSDPAALERMASTVRANVEKAEALGRWPANVIHDGSDEVVEAFPAAPGQMADASIQTGARKLQNVYGAMNRAHELSADRVYTDQGGTNFAMKPGARRLDTGSAARFFYCAKASRADRNEGLEDPGPQFKKGTVLRDVEVAAAAGELGGNTHPTVKPTDLMAYLCRLVTPPGGVVLDPFMGSGSTGKAAMQEGFRFIGIDITEEYVSIAERRIAYALRKSLMPRDSEGNVVVPTVVDTRQVDMFGAD